MTRRKMTLLLCLAAVLAVVVAAQVIYNRNRSSSAVDTYPPSVAAGSDVLAGITVVPKRIRGRDYQRGMFGESWTDDTDAPGGRNGCDTRFLGGFGVLSETLRKVPFTPRTFR